MEDKRDEIFEKRRKQLEEKSANFQIKCYPTSIWEASLYKAWTQIVSELSPNKSKIEKSLQNFVEACEADEVVLFEKNTFLLCFSYCIKKENDSQKGILIGFFIIGSFEKIFDLKLFEFRYSLY